MDFQVYKDRRGKFRWRLVNADGSLVSLPKPPPASRDEAAQRADRRVQDALRHRYEQQAH